MRPIVAAFALLLAGAVSTVSPEASAVSEAVRESAGVSLVQVPVTVVDRDGRPVSNLTASDFELRDNGKTVTLQSVDATTFMAPSVVRPANEGVAVDAAARRRFLLLFDLSYSSPVKIGRIREAALHFVQKQIAPEDLVAVATVSVEKGVNLLVTFTPDRAQLMEAVSSLGVVHRGSLAPDPLKLTQLLRVPEPSTVEGGQNRSNAAGSGNLISEIQQLSDLIRRKDDAYLRGRVTAFLQSLNSLATSLGSVVGRKQIIYFSQGFDMRLLQGTAEDSVATQRNAERAIEGTTWNVDSEQRFGSSGMQSALNSVLDQFKRFDCVINAVDLSGLTTAGADPSGDPSLGNGRSALFALAAGTGGEVFKNANDFGGQLEKLLARQSVVYVLVFSPNLTGHPGKLHDIKVRVHGEGFQVFARSAYVEPRPFGASNAVERGLSAADIIAAEIPRNDILVHISAYPSLSGRGARAPIFVQVPSLPETAGKEKVSLEVYLYAFGSNGKVADFATIRTAIDPEKVGQTLNAGGVTVYSSLRLPPGEYRLRALVRNTSTGAAGLSAVSITVPAEAEKKPTLLPPIFVGAQSAGVMLTATSAQSGESGAEPYPFTAGGVFVPKDPAEFSAGADIRLCLYAYHLGAAGSNPGLQVWGDILDASGTTVGEASLIPGAHSRPDDSERSTLLVTLKTAGLAPGSYRIRIGLNREGADPIESVSEFRLI